MGTRFEVGGPRESTQKWRYVVCALEEFVTVVERM